MPSFVRPGGAVALAALLALSPSAALAGKRKIQHEEVVSLPAEASSVAVPGIGRLTDVAPAPDGWAVAGTEGVALLGADLGVRWSLALPAAQFRQVAADEGGLVWSAYSDAGSEPVSGMKGLLGKTYKSRYTFAGASAGAVGLGGAPGWTADLGQGLPVSGPALTAERAYLVSHDAVLTVSRVDGAAARTSLDERTGKDAGLASKMLGGGMIGRLLGADAESLRIVSDIMQRSSRPLAPVLHAGAVWAQVGWFTVQLAPDGEIAWVSPPLKGRVAQGTAAPVVFGEQVVFGGTSGVPGQKDRVVGLQPRAGKDPKVAFGTFVLDQVKGLETSTSTNWTLFGLTDLDVLDDEHLLVTGEVTARMLNHKGKVQWEAWNKKGGLYPARSRSLDLAAIAPRRQSHGHLAVAHGDAVYVASVAGDTDVLTVLDAEKGRYRQSWRVDGRLADLAEAPGALAVLTEDRLVVVPR